MKSFLNIVNEYDNFPFYDSTEPTHYQKYADNLWHFHLHNDPRPHGYIPSFVVETMPWTSEFQLDDKSTPKRVQMCTDLPADANAAIAALLKTAREKNLFKCLKGWRNEEYRVLGARTNIQIERAGASLFGIMTVGVHMTVYTRSSTGELHLWIPQRSMSTTTNPGMLDNSVAGGVPAGVEPFECLVKEAADEASLPEELTRRWAKAVGCVTEFNIKDEGKGLLQPSVKYVYDMEIDEKTKLLPADGEVEAFRLMSVEDVKAKLLEGKFKPMCAMVMIDFLIRHSILTSQNEKDYAELVARTHRYLPFPTAVSL